MARPARIEFPGAIYHVMSRGDGPTPVYRDEDDRTAFLEVVALAMDRFDAQVLAYCELDDHYHLVLHTRRANLSRLMRHVNGVYTQMFNRRHGLTGPLFHGRFKAILVDREAHLLRLCRDVERSPVAAGLVHAARQWPWSSFCAHACEAPTPPWLESDGLHAYVLGRPIANARDRQRAAKLHAALVDQRSTDARPVWQDEVRQQVYLGDAAFVARMRALADSTHRTPAAPKTRRPRTGTLQDCLARHADRAQALRAAYRDHGITMTAIARELDLSLSRVSRLIAEAERAAEAMGGG